MGDNITRDRTVVADEMIDQWKSMSGGMFDITIENIDPGNSSVKVHIDNDNGPAGSLPVDLVTVASTDMFPSGPHRCVVAGAVGGTVSLVSVSEPGGPTQCHVTYTFKWSQ